MATGDSAFFDGRHWVIMLPFTESGVDRLRKLMAHTRAGDSSKVLHRALQALTLFLSRAEKGESFFAQLGNSFSRFNFVDSDDDPMFAESVDAADTLVTLRMDTGYHRVFAAICTRMNEDDLAVIYAALLHYEWRVTKQMTGHVLKYGKLRRLDEEEET